MRTESHPILVPFGEDRIAVELPPGATTTVHAPATIPDRGWEPGWEPVLRKQLRPLCGPGLAIVVNDATRPTPSREILRRVADLIPATATIHVATGLHPSPTQDELGTIIPEELRHLEVVPHDSEKNLTKVGVTGRGTPVLSGRRFLASRRILLIGSVEPHYFAGFTGGRKGLVPGLAGRATILANHRLALDPRAAPLALAGNPVHEDLEEAVRLVLRRGRMRLLHVSTVVDGGGGLAGLHAGTLASAFNASVAVSRTLHTATLDRPLDIAVAVAAPPLCGDLFQAHKAIENVQSAVRDGGAIIWVAGTGERGSGTWLDQLAEADSPAAVVRWGDAILAGKRRYDFSVHKAVRLARVQQRVRVLTVSLVKDVVLEEADLWPCADPAEAMAEAVRGLRGSPGSSPGKVRIGVFPQATLTVPVVKRAVGRGIDAQRRAPTSVTRRRPARGGRRGAPGSRSLK